MNILMAGIKWFHNEPGGLSRYFVDLAAGLAGAGDQVTAVVHGSRPPVGQANGIAVKCVDGAHILSRILGFYKTVSRELVARDYDIYNPHFALYALVPLLLKKGRSCAVVFNFQGPWAEEGRLELDGRFFWGNLKRSFSSSVKKFIESLTYKSCDKIIVLSRDFKKILVEQYGIKPDKIAVIPGGCDTNRFVPGSRIKSRQALHLPLDRKIIFTARRLVKRVGVEVLLRATKLLTNRHPGLLAVVAGEGPLKVELEALVVKLGLESSVIFTGYVSEPQLPLYYRAADVVAIPSVAYEGFGLVTVEALACGVPVVGTPVGGTREILEGLESRLLSDSARPRDFAAALERVIAMESWVPGAKECRSFVVDNYSWPRIIGEMRKLFIEVKNEKLIPKNGWEPSI